MKALLMVLDQDGTPTELVEAHRCDSKDHEPRLALRRLHWPTGPTEKCNDCADRLLEIGRVMGVHVHDEPIPLPEAVTRSPRRAMSFT